jgi:hypothetical protein
VWTDKHESLHNATNSSPSTTMSGPIQFSTIHRYITSQKATSLQEGVKIIRDVLKSNPFPNGFTTAQIFQVAVQQPPPPDFPKYHHTSRPPREVKNKDRYRKVKPLMPWAPSHPEHPIRSIRYVPIFFQLFNII